MYMAMSTTFFSKEEAMERLLSIQEASESLGLSSWTIRRWIQIKRLVPVRLGSRVLLEESELQRVIQEGKKSTDDDNNLSSHRL